MTFLRELLAAILGVLISFMIMFFVFVAIGSVLSSRLMEDEKIVVKNNTVLVLKFEDLIKDYAPASDDPLAQILGLEENKLGLDQILNAIDNAKYDDNILGISIESLVLRAGMAQIQEIREKLYEFKESGKFITAFADVYEQKNLYLSSVADSVYVNPVGMIDFRGLAGEVLFFKDFQDKYGVRMEVVRHGKYKSAVEPFLDNKMSEANREQTEAFLQSIWSEMVDDMSESRAIEQKQLNFIADELLARSPKLAIENKMVNGEMYRDEYVKVLKKLSGIDEDGKINSVSIKNYISTGKGRIINNASDRIAVIYAQGDIMYGKGDENYIGPDLIIKALKKARKDKRIKAIVLRVNSPGGSALASDIIWREIEVTKKDKPVVVSMGNLAASGGYYISCNADKIIADPMTITGSIGVFGMIPNISKFTDRIGINAEQVGTNRRSLDYSLFEPMSDDFYNVTKEGIERVYKTFVSKVAEGRNMTFEEVDRIAQGRVWTGEQALENGLVDELGGLEDAIKSAAKMADIQDYRIRSYPDYKKEFKDMISGPMLSIKNDLILSEIGEENLKIYQQIKQFGEWKGIQTRLPFLIEIK
ncbi:signal peptide peptidase SppA [Lutimonas saemankumensis]|uniref:signal peptide peptidase SppA n=1 Tax=Lutimonas saemankumensis TaxID=483016 RepID=UPI001CD5375E|nr:signal peptide peptidase SppA [Lutimonas saemankumensis]MCA0933540.1 signal peptide peptidase SppA [Lutimonas saemankumensis]